MHAPTVLLIDGDRDSLDIYSSILRHHGFRVLVTDDGETGFALACEHQPELVVLEPFVLLAHGVPLTELLQADARTSALSVLLVTGAPTVVESTKSVGRWGERYLVKPCRPGRFLAEVRRRLEPLSSAA